MDEEVPGLSGASEKPPLRQPEAREHERVEKTLTGLTHKGHPTRRTWCHPFIRSLTQQSPWTSYCGPAPARRAGGIADRDSNGL